MKTPVIVAVASVLILGVCAVAFEQTSKPAFTPMADGAAVTYEHLATAMLEIAATEHSLVKSCLTQYFNTAQEHLTTAAVTTGSEQSANLESAAAEITKIAGEGDKGIQAVRQRLLKAGYQHFTDDTKYDYIFVDSSEKKEFLDLSTKVSKLSDPKAIAETSRTFKSLFEKALTPDGNSKLSHAHHGIAD